MGGGEPQPAGGAAAARGAAPRFSLLDVTLTGIRLEEAVSRIVGFRDSGERGYVCVFAVDSLLKCHDDPRLAAISRASAMTLCDGMPLVLAGRVFGRLDVSRCYGPDVMLGVADAGRAAGLRHYFYGGSDEDTLRRLRANLAAKFPGLVDAGGEVPPFHPLSDAERAETAARINAAKPDVVWVGIGTPKQDFWVSEMRPLLDAPVLVAVGAAFNFHAGKVSQAPPWMRRNCLEWLYRLCVEPRRLWRRYLIGNPRFVLLVLRQMLTRRPAPVGAPARAQEVPAR